MRKKKDMNKQYIRYAVGKRSENFWTLTGVVTMAKLLRKDEILSPEEVKEVNNIFQWLNDNVPCPSFKANIKSNRWTKDAVSWWCIDAKLPINKMRKLIRILRKYGNIVRTLKTSRPGKIVYRDKFQVVAETPKNKEKL